MDNEDFRKKVCAWLEANGLDPAATPVEPHASIANGMLTLLQKTRRRVASGRMADIVDTTGYGILTHTISVPLLVEPDDEVRQWLQPKCPTCGR